MTTSSYFRLLEKALIPLCCVVQRPPFILLGHGGEFSSALHPDILAPHVAEAEGASVAGCHTGVGWSGRGLWKDRRQQGSIPLAACWESPCSDTANDATCGIWSLAGSVALRELLWPSEQG